MILRTKKIKYKRRDITRYEDVSRFYTRAGHSSVADRSVAQLQSQLTRNRAFICASSLYRCQATVIPCRTIISGD